MTVWKFFGWSDFLDHEVLRPLSHIRANWELKWDHSTGQYAPEDGSYAQLLNELVDEIELCDPPRRYHDNEDRLGEFVQRRLNWGVYKEGNRWLNREGKVLTPPDYISLLEQGGFEDLDQEELVLAAAGRIRAAVSRGQLHFDDMERSHQVMLAGVLAVILYHQS